MTKNRLNFLRTTSLSSVGVANNIATGPTNVSLAIGNKPDLITGAGWPEA